MNELKFPIDICFLRLDFETFTINGPVDSQEVNGGACTDTFKITVSYSLFLYIPPTLNSILISVTLVGRAMRYFQRPKSSTLLKLTQNTNFQ